MVPTRTMPLTSMSYSQITAITAAKEMKDSPNTLSTTTGPAGLRRVEERGAAAATGLGIAYLPAGMPSTGIAAELLVDYTAAAPPAEQAVKHMEPTVKQVVKHMEASLQTVA